MSTQDENCSLDLIDDHDSNDVGEELLEPTSENEFMDVPEDSITNDFSEKSEITAEAFTDTEDVLEEEESREPTNEEFDEIENSVSRFALFERPVVEASSNEETSEEKEVLEEMEEQTTSDMTPQETSDDEPLEENATENVEDLPTEKEEDNLIQTNNIINE